jgi:hypothetical protein
MFGHKHIFTTFKTTRRSMRSDCTNTLASSAISNRNILFHPKTARCLSSLQLRTYFTPRGNNLESRPASIDIKEKEFIIMWWAGQCRPENSNKHYLCRVYENVAPLKYMGTRVINQKLIHEEIKRRLILGNACYHSVQKLLSSRLLSKNRKN